MIQSSKSQLINAKNQYQSKKKRVLCVCSAGVLRSPTMAEFLQRTYGYNVRACGVDDDYSLIPLSSALLVWADEIHVVDEEYEDLVEQMSFINNIRPVFVVDVADSYDAFSDEMYESIEYCYKMYDDWLIRNSKI